MHDSQGSHGFSQRKRRGMKHEWVLMGGGGGWEIWRCEICKRKAIPLIFGIFWPFPRCRHEPIRRVSIRREVEVEAGKEHAWWTVVDHASGYNKTFRDESEAYAHAEAIKRNTSALRKAAHDAQRQYIKNRK